MMKLGEKILFWIVGLLVVITVINFTALQKASHSSDKPLYPILTHYDFTPAGLRGYTIYEHNNCYDCHKAVGSGTSMGVTLDGLGSKHDLNYFYNFLKYPEKTYGAETMSHGAPPKDAAYVSSLPDSDLHDMAVFVSELKADQGSSTAYEPPKGESSFIDTMLYMWTPEGWRSKYQDIRDWMKSKPQEAQHDGKQ